MLNIIENFILVLIIGSQDALLTFGLCIGQKAQKYNQIKAVVTVLRLQIILFSLK
jgi:hypothetical protein